MKRQVILVRHGTHDEVGRVLSGRSAIALNQRGLAQAWNVAAALEHAELASLHTSPRRRAAETIAPIARDRHLPVRTSGALDEIDFGGFTGRTFAELDGDPDWQRWNAERGTARCPGGETMAEAVARAAGYLAALGPEDFPALCVTHCDVIRGIVAHVLGLDLAHMFRFECDPASLTTLDLTDGRMRLIALNERVRQ
jgi:broad specificity phosphatase PhoE